METLVKYVFIFQICIAPLGLVLAISYLKTARKVDDSKRDYYRAIALARFVVALLDASIGSLGYYLVSKRVFPGMDPGWLLFLPAFSGLVLILLTKRAQHIRIRVQESER